MFQKYSPGLGKTTESDFGKTSLKVLSRRLSLEKNFGTNNGIISGKVF